MRNRTIPLGANVIAFREEVTQKSFGHDFNAQDFNFPWFNTSLQQNAQNAPSAWNYEQVVQGMAGLGIEKTDTPNSGIVETLFCLKKW